MVVGIAILAVLLLLIAGPWAGISVHESVRERSRNADKSHDFEHETAVVAKAVAGTARKVDQVKGKEDKRIKGDNMRDYRKRL